ncbi:hypothetical protein [Dysgonomonas sp. 520]|uniref:hypothetical protein n=1 Tax=Dysgonomonas sp. 520 TaxID=2302931 RepID=UPI0013D67568|nr:hypothetical protein [Dysgonomonas sp. 520]NDW10357.1 hypothetical protein [Dysgonomonas sp. 520]
MKYINKILLFVVGCGLLASCTINDPIDDLNRVGEFAPTVYWELKSDAVKAGDSVEISRLQYYPLDGKSIANISVWYDVSRVTTISASCPLVTSFTFNYTPVDTTELVRVFQYIKDFPHSESFWSDKDLTYLMNVKFPTSYTLRSTIWKDVEKWDQTKYETLFPEGFLEEFREKLYPQLEVEDLQKILTSTNPRFETEEDFMKHVKRDSTENKGVFYVIKEESKELIKEKFYSIPLDSLTYKSADGLFMVSYDRYYFLNASVRVEDSNGIASFTEKKKITLN